MEEYKKEPEIEKTKVPKKGTDTHSPETTWSAHMGLVATKPVLEVSNKATLKPVSPATETS